MSRPNFGPLTWFISGSPTLDSVSFPSLHMEQSHVWMAACGCHKKQSWKQLRGTVRFIHYCLQFSKSAVCVGGLHVGWWYHSVFKEEVQGWQCKFASNKVIC
jgi:hypothetical protein